MKTHLIAWFVCAGCSISVMAAPPVSAYAGQQARDIKALSQEEVYAYLSGKGMGLARAAELNGYAGPAHVLELSQELVLTPDQRARTEALFAAMTNQAVSLGQDLVEQERKLDRLFASRSITSVAMVAALEQLGALQAKVRAVHLAAHLAQVEILSAEQNARYAQLRGYANAVGSAKQGGQHRH